jgi:hypothetical protein
MDFKVKSPQQVKRFLNEKASKTLVFDVRWEFGTAPPNSPVGIKAFSRVSIEAAAAEVRIYHLLNSRETQVETLNAPFENGKIETVWRTKPVRAGNFEEGIYHVRVFVNGYTGETIDGLKLTDSVAQRYRDNFDFSLPVRPKVIF